MWEESYLFMGNRKGTEEKSLSGHSGKPKGNTGKPKRKANGVVEIFKGTSKGRPPIQIPIFDEPHLELLPPRPPTMASFWTVLARKFFRNLLLIKVHVQFDPAIYHRRGINWKAVNTSWKFLGGHYRYSDAVIASLLGLL